MDPEQPYQSGARLYFDARRMAEEGLLIRDGAHIKVKDSLPLIPYLLWTATWKELGLPDRVTTPRVFSQMADKVFETEIMHAKGICASC